MSDYPKLTKQDVVRAERVSRLVTTAREKAQEARNLLTEAHQLASEDPYASVKDYDAQDIKDTAVALKVAGTRPIIQLELRWDAIVSGRKEGLRYGG